MNWQNIAELVSKQPQQQGGGGWLGGIAGQLQQPQQQGFGASLAGLAGNPSYQQGGAPGGFQGGYSQFGGLGSMQAPQFGATFGQQSAGTVPQHNQQQPRDFFGGSVGPYWFGGAGR